MAYPSDGFKRQAPRPEGFVPFDPVEIEGSIGRRFENMVALHADRLAYEDEEGRTLSYAELNSRANRVAHRILNERAPEKNKPALLLFGYSPQTFIGSMALIKAGRVAVGLDSASPAAHMRELANDSEADLLLTDSDHFDEAVALGLDGIEIVNIDAITGTSGDEGNPDYEITPDDYSHIFYSSGSTGKPKGIIHSHRSALHLICYLTKRYQFYPGDRLPYYLSLSLATILLRVYAPLLTGGMVLPFDLKSRGIEAFMQWFQDYRLTMLTSNATMYRLFMQQVHDPDQLPHLRLLSLGGEGLRWSDITTYRRWFNGRALGLTYGTTEALWVTNSFLSDASPLDEEIQPPCGYTFGQHEVLLVDENREPVPEGEIGEFAVRSRYLSPGYWRQPELSDSVFLRDPDEPDARLYLTGDLGRLIESGLHFHLGRKDDQLKVRGYRVEPGEIESALLHIKDVQDAAVSGRGDQNGDTRLIAYVVCSDHSLLKEDDIRRILQKSLPDQLIPARIVFLDHMPRTANGKVDRRKLPDPRRERPSLSVPYAAPRHEIEMALCAIWADELDLETVGIDDLFFDLGGHSLLATRLITRVSEACGLRVSHETLFDAPTVRQMATLLEELLGEDDQDWKERIRPIPRVDHQMRQSDSGIIIRDSE